MSARQKNLAGNCMSAIGAIEALASDCKPASDAEKAISDGDAHRVGRGCRIVFRDLACAEMTNLTVFKL